MIKTQAGALLMTDNPGNVMDYILIAVPVLLLLGAVAAAGIRRWKVRKVAKLRSRQLEAHQARRQALEAHQARRHVPETQTVMADPSDKEIASAVAAAFDDIDRRIEAALASLDKYTVAQAPDGVPAQR